jgi:hypothetical protein
MQSEFIDLERRCAATPGDSPARQRMLQLFFALGQPEWLPGARLRLAAEHPPPRIAVLTPYCREPLFVLARCHASVRVQTIACDHIMVADGYARGEIDAWDVRHVRLDSPSADFGDTPRRIGGQIAQDGRYDAVAYLDADNAFRPHHVESLFALVVQQGVTVCHAARTLHRTDGTLMPLLQRSDNSEHVDTSCLMVAAAGFDLLSLWASWPRALSAIDDRMFWQSIVGRGTRTAFSGALTCRYEASHVGFFHAMGETPPAGTRPDIDLDRVFRDFAALSSAEREAVEQRCGFAVERFIASLRAQWHQPGQPPATLPAGNTRRLQ